MRLTHLIGLSAALHLYIGTRLVSAFPDTFLAAVLALFLVVSTGLMPMGMIARRLVKPPLADTLAVIGLSFMGLFSSLLVFTVLRDALLLLLWIASLVLPSVPLDPFRVESAAAVPFMAIVVTLLGYWNARRTAGVKIVDVPFANLPPALQGFRIVQISDIHVGPTIRHRYVESIVEAVNRLKPDVVAITGDLVDGSVPELGEQVAPLGRLVSRYGSFFVTGNHEYYSGVGPWVAELERLGITVLHNQHVVIDHGGAKVVLAGVTDFTGGYFDEGHRSDPGAAMAGSPANAAVKVLLAHQPRSAAAAAQAGFDLQLSGHTHGGQFWPWNFFVRFQQPFTAGLHRLGRLWVYVSRGTGYWGPPKRFGAPSEITEVRLMAAAV